MNTQHAKTLILAMTLGVAIAGCTTTSDQTASSSTDVGQPGLRSQP